MDYVSPPFCATCLLLFVLPTLMNSTRLTECDRGVKRPHLSQENAYQIYVLDPAPRWLDQSCPAPRVFDVVRCLCVRPKKATQPPTPSTTASTTTTHKRKKLNPDPKDTSQKESPWFARKGDAETRNEVRNADDGKPPRRRRNKRVLDPSKRPLPSQRPSRSKKQPLRPQRKPRTSQRPRLSTKPRPSQEPRPARKPRPLKRTRPSVRVQKDEGIFPPSVILEDRAPVKKEVDCSHHRPGKGGGGAYEQLTEYGWVEGNCNWPVQSGLIWNQDNCRCDWGPNPVLPRHTQNSVPAVCLMMLKLNFDDGEVKDAGRGLWLDLTHPGQSEALQAEGATGGWAGAFRGTGLAVPFFKMNTLGATFRIKFRFQLCDGEPDADLMLLNNGCLETDQLPSLQVVYRAWTSTLYFQMATAETAGPVREECRVQHQHPWVDVNIHYDDGLLEIFVDGRQCVRSVAYSGPIMETDCPLTLLEDNFCGLLDEVVVTRGCTAAQES